MPPSRPGLPTLSVGVPSPKLAASGVGDARSPGSPQGVPAPPEFGVLVLLMHSPSGLPHCHAVLGDLHLHVPERRHPREFEDSFWHPQKLFSFLSSVPDLGDSILEALQGR